MKQLGQVVIVCCRAIDALSKTTTASLGLCCISSLVSLRGEDVLSVCGQRGQPRHVKDVALMKEQC